MLTDDFDAIRNVSNRDLILVLTKELPQNSNDTVIRAADLILRQHYDVRFDLYKEICSLSLYRVCQLLPFVQSEALLEEDAFFIFEHFKVKTLIY